MTGQHPEQLLWNRMRTNLRSLSAHNELRLQRIEQMLEDGMPDVMAIRQGRVSMIELKSTVKPIRPTTKLFRVNKGMRIEQRNWILDWRQHGGRALVVIGVIDESEIIHLAIEGVYVDEINDMTYQEASEKAIVMGSGSSFWNGLRQAL